MILLCRKTLPNQNHLLRSFLCDFIGFIMPSKWLRDRQKQEHEDHKKRVRFSYELCIFFLS